MKSGVKINQVFFNRDQFNKYLFKSTEEKFLKKGEKMFLQLFKEKTKKVSAYKKFLKENKISINQIQSIKDLDKIPLIDKNNYLRKYNLEELTWDGHFNGSYTISVNSGSTGEPFYFPRSIDQDWQYALVAEQYLLNNFSIDKKTTLYINTFAMGVWIGGLFTFEAIRLLSEKGNYNLSLINTGIHKDEIFRAVKNLGDKFDQIIIGGYPPFVKDILDLGETQNINWKKYNLRFVFSAEGFSEEFREYVYKKAGVKNYYLSSLNHYGTADMGTMAHETPLTILVRKLANKNKKLRKDLFNRSDTLPTLVQYIPEFFYFESVNGILVCSGYSGLPFFRYNLKDVGGVIKYSEICQIFKQNKINLEKEIEKNNLVNYVTKLPFVFLFERDDFVVKLYGANIYPETIRHVLQKTKYEKIFSGKFTMLVKTDLKQNQKLEINLELKPQVVNKISKKEIVDDIVEQLIKENSEFKSNYLSLPNQQKPEVNIWNFESEIYFKPGGKQRWIKK